MVPTVLPRSGMGNTEEQRNSTEIQTSVSTGQLLRNSFEESLEPQILESKKTMAVMFKGMQIGDAIYNPNGLEIKAKAFGFANISQLTEVFNKMKRELNLPIVKRTDVNSSIQMLSPGPEGMILAKWAAFTDLGRDYLQMIADCLAESHPNLFVSAKEAKLDYAMLDDKTPKRAMLTGGEEMNQYQDVKAAYLDIVKTIMDKGMIVQSENFHDKDVKDNPEYETREMVGFSYQIDKPTIEDAEAMINLASVGLPWAQAEFESRVEVEPKNPGTAYKNKEDFWKKMLESTGKFSYTYGLRMRRFGGSEVSDSFVDASQEEKDCASDHGVRTDTVDQLQTVIDEIKLHPNTRQAVISIWDAEIDLHRLNQRRIPCSLTYQVLRRDGKLDIVYVSRSSDAVTLLPSDIYQALRLQKWVADQIGIPTGKFVHCIGSLHIYKKNEEKALKLLATVS
jgi:thymidylate synthase